MTVRAAGVPVKERDSFFEEREDLIPELHISDYELVRFGAAKADSSKVEVKWTWYKESEGVVHESIAARAKPASRAATLVRARIMGSTPPAYPKVRRKGGSSD